MSWIYVAVANWYSCSEINSLVMDYLVTQGYPSAAQKFAVEANIQPKADVVSIQERVEIRDAIDFLQQQSLRHGGGSDEPRVWADLCHVLLNVKEFIFIE